MEDNMKLAGLFCELFDCYKVSDIEKRLEAMTRMAIGSEEMNEEPIERENMITFKNELVDLFRSAETLISKDKQKGI